MPLLCNPLAAVSRYTRDLLSDLLAAVGRRGTALAVAIASYGIILLVIRSLSAQDCLESCRLR
jgi:hypothetical protein